MEWCLKIWRAAAAVPDVNYVYSLLRFDDSVIDHKRRIVKLPRFASGGVKVADAGIGTKEINLVQ